MGNIQKLQELDIQILRSLANNNLNKIRTARELYIHRNTLEYRVNKIKALTGLNPFNFWDLVKLLGLKTNKKW